MKEFTLVVLAAGIGSRYGGEKQLERITENGETIIDFSIYDAISAGFSKIVLVVRDEILELVRERFARKLSGKVDAQYVCQDTKLIPAEFLPSTRTKPWGTGHALLSAKDFVNENFCVINADDFYGRSAFDEMHRILQKTDPQSCKFSMIGYLLKNTLSKNGSVSRGECFVDDKGYLEKIIERTAISSSDNKVFAKSSDGVKIDLNEKAIVSMNFWGFTGKIFPLLESKFEQFLNKNNFDDEAEFFLPKIVDGLIRENIVAVKVQRTDADWIGVTYKEDKPGLVARIKEMQEKGIYPRNLWK